MTKGSWYERIWEWRILGLQAGYASLQRMRTAIIGMYGNRESKSRYVLQFPDDVAADLEMAGSQDAEIFVGSH